MQNIKEVHVISLIKFLVLIYVSLSIISGKGIESFSIVGLRASQLIMIFTFPIIFYFFIVNKLYTEKIFIYLFIFFFIGFLAFTRGLIAHVPLAFLIPKIGIFLYAYFFIIGYMVFEKKEMMLLYQIVLYSTVVGLVGFSVLFFIANDQLPFLIRGSSDILPILSAALISSIIYSSYYSFIVRYFVVLPILICFSYMMLVKSAILGTLLSLVILFFRLYVKTTLFILFLISLLFLSWLYFHFNSLVAAAQSGDIFWNNILFRIFVWYDFLQVTVSSNLLMGNGIAIGESQSLAEHLKIASSHIDKFWFHLNPHNSYILLFYFSGLIGLSAFFMILFQALRISHFRTRMLSKEEFFFLPLMFSFLISALTTSFFELHYIAPIFWLLLGALYKSSAEINQKANNG